MSDVRIPCSPCDGTGVGTYDDDEARARGESTGIECHACGGSGQEEPCDEIDALREALCLALAAETVSGPARLWALRRADAIARLCGVVLP